MTITSMTGFARAQGEGGGNGAPAHSWTWEARSVNGKALDVRLRLPAGQEHLEIPAREAVAKRFSRGSLTLTLQERVEEAEAAAFTINEPLLAALMERARDLPAHIAPPRFDGLLAVRGVLVPARDASADEAARAAHDAALLATLGQALDGLAQARAEEGARLAAILGSHLATIAELVERAAASQSLKPDVVRDRLRAQLAELIAGQPSLAEDRLLQEAALIAIKADVREELDRLRAHLAQARDLMAQGGAVGRRLDFLCQEFNREANTFCAKSQDTELRRLGMELKTVIDQMREQVQNVE